jgi:very-short-patch-repair endonuclease
MAEGITPYQLRGPNWRRLSRGLYVWSGIDADPPAHLRALCNRLSDRSVFSHRTAARIHGVDVALRTSVAGQYEVTVPQHVRLSSSGELRVRHAPLDSSDIALLDGLPTTTPLRTSFDLARQLPLIEAVAATDALLHSGLVRQDQLQAFVCGRCAWRGVVQARHVVELAEARAESLMESVLRMVLLERGCPRPEVQHWIRDRRGTKIGRVDIWYEQARLAVEYDGDWHRHNLTDDNRRQNLLLAQGIRLLRFTASDVFQRPDVVAAQVRAQL